VVNDLTLFKLMKTVAEWVFIRLKQKFSEIIRREREKAGLSQDRLASTAGISTRFYQDIESGAKSASLETIFKLSNGLGCHYSVILEPLWEDWQK